MVMSEGRLWSGTSRKWSQIWYATVTSPIEKLLEQFIANDGAQTFSDSDWLDDISTQETIKLGFNIARTPTLFSGMFAPIQGYSGGELIAPELMNRVAISFRWKELLYRSGSSFNVASILQTRLIAGGKDRKEG